MFNTIGEFITIGIYGFLAGKQRDSSAALQSILRNVGNFDKTV